MKKLIALIMSILIAAGAVPVLAEDVEEMNEGETPVAAETEMTTPEDAGEAEAPKAEITETEAPVTETPASEKPEAPETADAAAPAVEETVTETVETEEAEAPAAETETVETETAETETAETETEAAEETETVAFTGRLYAELVNTDPIALGDAVTLRAAVSEANLSFIISWERWDPTAAEPAWENVSGESAYTFTATAKTPLYTYRVRVLAEDGTELTYGSFTITLAEETEETLSGEDAPAETEEPAEEIADEPETVEPVIEETEETEEPAEETEETEEPAEETEEAAAEETEEAAIEESAAEETLEIADYETPLGIIDPQTIVLEGSGEEDFRDVDVRENADGMSAIFTSLPEGAEVTVVAVDGDWATVAVNGHLGYIYLADLQAWLDAVADEDAEAEMKVTVFTSRRSVMHAGETVTLTGRLEGFEGLDVTCQWERDIHDGNGYQPIEGANADTYEFSASAETLSWDWRLTVTYN